MSIGLDNPGLAPLALLAGLPVLIHLIARPRPRLLRFPSLMLLEKAHRESVNLRRPRHWLLLILRTLWVLLLLGVFLQPRWFARPQGERTDGQRSLVIVLDATASMRARENGRSRYARATAEAVTLLRQLDTGDKANLIRVRAIPEPIYTEPGVNRDFLMEQVRQRPCSQEGGTLEAAVRLAVEQLATAEGDRELVVISDFQAEPDGSPPLLQVPEDIALTTLPVAEGGLPNQAITDVQLLPARPVRGQPFQIQVRVLNEAGQAVRLPLTLQIGSRFERLEVSVPASGSTLASLELEMESEGPLPVVASLEPDLFPDDDTRTCVLPLSSDLQIGISGSDATARMWKRTVDALPGVQSVRVDTLEALPERLDLLMISGWKGDAMEMLRRRVEAEMPLILKPAELPPAAAEWLGLPAGRFAVQRMDPPIGLRMPDPWPAELALFREDSYGSPARGLVSRHAVFPIQEEALIPILSLENGETVWGRVRRVPEVQFWNLPLGADESDLAQQPQWVPMFGEALRHSFRTSERLSSPAGTHLPTPLDGFEAKGLELVTLNQDPVLSEKGAGLVQSQDPLPPGLYEWRRGEEVLSMHAVLLPEAESHLTPMVPETQTGKELPKLETAEGWRELQEGIELWPWLLAAGLLIAAAEHALTQRKVPA